MRYKIAIVLAVVFTALLSVNVFAGKYFTSKYPDRMWMFQERGKSSGDEEIFDSRIKFCFLNKDEDVWGTLGVVKKGNDYFVIWQPIE